MLRTGALHRYFWEWSTASSLLHGAGLGLTRLLWSVLLLAALYPASPLMAEETAVSATLSLQPKLCALANTEEHCPEPVQVEWRAEPASDLCLYLEARPGPLACWEQERLGKHRYQDPIAQSLRFQLRLSNGGTLLTEEEFIVTREQIQYRQRRRRPWHFF